MDRIFHSLLRTPDEWQLILFTLILIVSWNIELIAGFSKNYKKWIHAALNGKFVFSNLPLQILVGIAFTLTIKWTSHHQFGIVYFKNYLKGHWGIFLVSFIFLDFGEYIYHVIMHKVKRFWMFHVVHHSDLVVDVSTSVREHPGENLIRNSFTLLWVFFSGVPFWAFLLRQIIQTTSNVFAHMNCRLPEKMDRIIGLLFITPNLHHVHHHYKQPYTDCNYGDVLSIWDRLFGTFSRMPATQIVFGVDSFMDRQENSKYISLFKMPFGKYRRSTIV